VNSLEIEASFRVQMDRLLCLVGGNAKDERITRLLDEVASGPLETPLVTGLDVAKFHSRMGSASLDGLSRI
jgi:hypothetical protein